MARGKLQVFLGFAPGVGKTWAMLTAAHEKKNRGIDVVVGFVQTHRRADTEALIQGLERLPTRRVQHRGHADEEFDVGAALARKPRLLLVDELAHKNAYGGHHDHRYEDVVELLDAGIDVMTTLNVQHLQGLNEVIEQVTGVRVRETVPDTILQQADAVELIDLPPDELLERLRAGKIVVNEQAQRALATFFRKQNLVALRELALRSTATLVSDDLQRHPKRDLLGKAGGGRLLVCVSPSPRSDGVVRAAHAMAAALSVPWYAVYVVRPEAPPLPEPDAQRLAKTLELARSLGAESVRVEGASLAEGVIAFARKTHVKRIVAGKPTHSRWVDALLGSQLDDLIRHSGDIDVLFVAGSSTT
jgi:two-component system sensor histidine kinase KdpD